ncbi:MAG: hypothetical protein HOJ35_08880 [Bdellovibrionales bacterium]|jgi:hypothetical protein|nr:hypothetical protein [Bdellovibrionales bacterium]
MSLNIKKLFPIDNYHNMSVNSELKTSKIDKKGSATTHLDYKNLFSSMDVFTYIKKIRNNQDNDLKRHLDII